MAKPEFIARQSAKAQNKIYWFKGAVSKARFTNRALSPREFMK